LEKVMNHKSNMNVDGESDGRVVPTKYSNKDGKPSAEGTEGRRSAKENSGQTTATLFGTISREWMIKFLKHRIADRRILRLIQKWLRAGVSEDGEWSKTEVGTPQGSVISPLLANVYLHYVFDLWVQHWRKHRAAGEVIVVRYARHFNQVRPGHNSTPSDLQEMVLRCTR
jgi:Reverse transcriptase (RNA-dependent DNA polymerase)